MKFTIITFIYYINIFTFSISNETNKGNYKKRNRKYYL